MGKLSKNQVLVFGSNARGAHGAGAALRARQAYGAKYGQGKGLQGQSYGIPTKDKSLKVLPPNKIESYVEEFKEFAAANPDKEFYVTKVGTGLANISSEVMANMFVGSPQNCIFSQGWKIYLGAKYRYFTGNL